MGGRLAATVAFAGLISLLAVGAATAATVGSSFVDPTASKVNADNIHLGEFDYVGPFARLIAGDDDDDVIHIGNESNVQDNSTVDASRAPVSLGEQAIVAHGGTIMGAESEDVAHEATLGETGACPGGAAVCPSFIGFNSLVEGASVEKDAMVTHLARVAPGITVPSGMKVLPGKNITTQAQAEDPALGKVSPVTEADRVFMHGVIEVNKALATGYNNLVANKGPDAVHGINYDPDTPFNVGEELPILAGRPTSAPRFSGRITDDVRMNNSLAQLRAMRVSGSMGPRVSIRGDEGDDFRIGKISSMGASSVFHALEGNSVRTGSGVAYGTRSLVHGGPSAYALDAANPTNATVLGPNNKLGRGSVFFRSRSGSGVVIGPRTLVLGADVPADTVIGGGKIILGDATANNWGSVTTYPVEW